MKQRIVSFDIFRGLLVLGMIVFHTTLHFFTGEIPVAILHFIPTGFVLFSGILIGRILSQKKTNWSITKRGLKLLILFLCCNIPFWIWQEISLYRIMVLFIMGNPEISLFEILLPIALTVIMAPIFFKTNYPTIFLILVWAILVLFDIFSWYPFTLKFLLIGIFGILLGRSFLSQYFLQEKFSKKFLIGSVLVGIIFLILFTQNISWWSGQIVFVLSIFVWSTQLLKNSLIIEKIVIPFGKYSLTLYMFHVAFIQFLKIFSIFTTNSFLLLCGEMCTITVMCFLFLQILKQFRTNTVFEKIYLLCFQ